MSDTVRVRIAVAVSASGKWSASGGSGAPDALSSEIAMNDLCDCEGAPPGEDRVAIFVEADAPLPVKPEPQTVEGEVESETEGGR